MRLPELLAPAGDADKLTAALLYGADAVYLGAKQYSLRARAGNFAPEALREAVAAAHGRGAKAYVTDNIYARQDDLRSLPLHLSTDMPLLSDDFAPMERYALILLR